MTKRFVYREPSKESLNKRASQTGGMYDSVLKDDIPVFKPKEGSNCVRFLPSTWDGAEHYGLDVYIHYGIGPDSQRYLCLDKMKGEPCPICEEHRRAQRSGEGDYASALRPTKRVLVWMIDRDKESEGPQLWLIPFTVDRDISSLSINKRTGEVLAIDHPEKGYDVEFERKGTDLKTKYVGLQIARDSVYLGPDEKTEDTWLNYILDKPLPTLLCYFEYDYITKVFIGQTSKEDAMEETSEKPLRTRRSRRQEEPAPHESSEDARKEPRTRIEDPNEPLDEDPPKEEAAPKRPERASSRQAGTRREREPGALRASIRGQVEGRRE